MAQVRPGVVAENGEKPVMHFGDAEDSIVKLNQDVKAL